MEESYKVIDDKQFDHTSVLKTPDLLFIDENENIIDFNDFSEFDSIDNLYLQIEICYKTFDYESLKSDLLPKFQQFINKDDFEFTNSFFENEIDTILLNLLPKIEEEGKEEEEDKEESFSPDFDLQNLSISIIQDLFIRFGSFFPQNSIINFMNHAKHIIQKWENGILLKKVMNCLFILCKEHDWLLENHIDHTYLLDKLDQHEKTNFDSPSFFYDDDSNDQISLSIKQILLKLTPNLENLTLIINNGDCGMKRFSIFLWLLIRDCSLISLFNPSLYLPKILAILERSRDYSLIFPSIIFLSNIWNIITDNSTVLLLFPFIQLIQSSEDDKLSSNPPIDTLLDQDKKNNLYSISLYCISCFISCGPDEACFCIENGIIDLILDNVNLNYCQNQIKREASKCLCNIVQYTPQSFSTISYIQQFYANENIIDLLLNVLEFDEIDIDELIIKTLICLIDTENFDLSLLLAKFADNYDVFSNLLDNEEHEIVMLTQQFLELYENIKGQEE